MALDGYPINTRYAEHPYVESYVEDVRINIVPCYAVAPGEWQSAADRSPYHTKYIQGKLDERLRLEARLFKKFVKTSGVYGAEVKIQGFSGYVCEVLTIKFGSFLETLQSLSKLNPGEVISIEAYDKDLAASFKSPVVILDPVDTTRNLGSAISGRNLGKLVLECRRFLSKPSIQFFLPKRPAKLSGKSIRSKLPLFSKLLIVQFRIDSRSPDILWGELRKSSASISDKLAGYGYQILRHSAASDEKENAALLFLLSNLRMEGLSTRQGPDYFRAEEVEKYFEKNRGKALLTWMGEEGKLKSAFERKEILESAASALDWMLQKKNIDRIGVSSRIRKELLKKHRILMATHAMKAGKNQEWLTKENPRYYFRRLRGTALQRVLVRDSYEKVILSPGELNRKEHGEVLCYPGTDLSSFRSRVSQLKALGVESLILEGDSKVGKFGIVGRGCVSTVVKARLSTDSRVIALKIRRADANRPDMSHDFELQKFANSFGVGPERSSPRRIYSRWSTSMSIKVGKWFQSLKTRSSKKFLRKLIRNTLEQCYLLDVNGLDHGELEQPLKARTHQKILPLSKNRNHRLRVSEPEQTGG